MLQSHLRDREGGDLNLFHASFFGDYASLRNIVYAFFFIFVPPPVILRFLLSVLFFPASPTLPPPNSPGLPRPAPSSQPLFKAPNGRKGKCLSEKMFKKNYRVKTYMTNKSKKSFFLNILQSQNSQKTNSTTKRRGR